MNRGTPRYLGSRTPQDPPSVGYHSMIQYDLRRAHFDRYLMCWYSSEFAEEWLFSGCRISFEPVRNAVSFRGNRGSTCKVRSNGSLGTGGLVSSAAPKARRSFSTVRVCRTLISMVCEKE